MPNPTKEYTVTYADNNSKDTAVHTFNGWYNGSTRVTSTTDAPKSNHTLTASWTSKSITLQNRKKAGYTFGGWYKEANCINKVGDAGVSYEPKSDITLYPKWTANTYQVRYNGNGSTSGSMANSTHTYDKAQN